ncbi:ROK family glucokinase [Candidatus Omnitrophus magneticus]|uniref:ROK family glucokinase n=1 Tax=Candidatus Omnitrophus magneticus TaxID=1609969 RepID=A0A0F0CNW9_9BACT|nr:ROK family glucokinase [Candidatus Omnitrophus magneticus]
MAKYFLGIDIGGTKIASGLVSAEGKLKKSIILPTLAERGKNVSLNQLFISIDMLLKTGGVSKKDIKGIGVCAPGPLNPQKRIIYNPPNLQGWVKVPLGDLVEERLKIKTKVENDANAAGVAEMLWGSAKGYKNIFYVTVSTGIGTGIIIDGKLYHGKNGMAGEGGHVTISYNDETVLCACGSKGCIEALASGPNTVKRFLKNISRGPEGESLTVNMTKNGAADITMKTIADAAKRGDSLAIKTIQEEGRFLGIWLGNMINILDPEIIVIGGGVSLIGNLLFKEIKDTVKKHTINIFASKTPIVAAKLKKNVGVFGAAAIAMI